MNPGEEYIYGHYVFEIKKIFLMCYLIKGLKWRKVEGGQLL